MRAPDFWNKRGGAAYALAPLGFFQAASVAWKARHAQPYRAKAKVVCVGNLTLGGSGKTPIARALATMLEARGQNPFFLTRGYGGAIKGPYRVRPKDNARMVGDEALLLARTAPTIVARDRRAGAILAECEGAGCIVLDDGHQNFSLAKDLSLVVVDGETGFGNGFVFPAGSLREPVAQGLARADAVVVVGDGNPDLAGFGGPLLRASFGANAPQFSGRRVFAFAGIGRPQKFLDSLTSCGGVVVGSKFFADHHFYRAGEITALKERAGDALLVTTEKDFARLGAEQAKGIAVLHIEAVFEQPHLLAALLDRPGPAV